MTKKEFEQKLAAAVMLVKAMFPFQADLVAHARISLDDRVRTACVFPSGRILLSPAFIDDMTTAELAFLIEHEIMHVYYKTNERSRLFVDHVMANVAHDLVINGELVEVFSFACPPKGGLHWPDFEESVRFLHEKGILNEGYKPIGEYSFEEMVALLTTFRNNVHLLPSKTLKALANASSFPDALKKDETKQMPLNNGVWDVLDQLISDKSEGEAETHEKTAENASKPSDEAPPSDPSAEAEKARQKWLGVLFSEDARSSKDELELFPDESPLKITKEEQETTDLIRTMTARKEAIEINSEMTRRLQNCHNKVTVGNGADTVKLWDVKILRGKYSDSWEMALQAWIDESAPPARSWARASRRGADRTDVVLPGRERVNEWMLNIVLDVSGSMWSVLPAILGHIQAFGISAGVRYVRMVESVEDCKIDNIMEISELGKYKMPLADGSDLSPAMLKLAEDTSVESVLVLTDGDVFVPSAEKIPYKVVWGLTEKAPEDFGADYGIKIAVHVDSNK